MNTTSVALPQFSGRVSVSKLVAWTAVCVLLFAGQSRAGEWPRVVTTIAPLQSLVANLMAGGEQPSLLFDRPTAGHHHAALKPSQARQLAEADLLVWVGPLLEQPVAKVLANNRFNGREWRADECVGLTLQGLPGAADSDLEEHKSGNSVPVEASSIDPHVWLNPINALCYVGELKILLIELDPAHEGLYRVNAARTEQRLRSLDQALSNQLADVNEPFMTYHNSFNYLLRHYGLQAVGGLAVTDDRPPTLRQVLEFRRLLKESAATCLLADSSGSRQQLDQWRAGSEARLQLIDPMGGRLDPGPELYFQLLSNMATEIADCVQGK